MSFDINQAFQLLGMVIAGSGGTWLATQAVKKLSKAKAWIRDKDTRTRAVLGVATLFSLLGTVGVELASDTVLSVDTAKGWIVTAMVIAAQVFGAKGIHEFKK